MEGREVGLLVVAIGIVVVVAGLLIMSGALGWFGRLPGDLRFGSGGVRVYIPITTMLLLSVLLTIALYVLRRLF